MSSNMDPLIGASLIGAGTSIVGSVGGSLLNKKQNYNLQRREQQFNRNMAEWQNQQNLAFWQMQNDYNTPANQVKRLMEAGLNPALLYGNGSTATGNATSAPDAAKVQAAPGHATDFRDLGAADAVSALMQGQQLSMQNKLQQSQIDLQKAQEQEHLQKALESEAKTNNLNADTHNKLWQYNYNDSVSQLMKDQLTANLAFTRANTEGINSRIQLNNASIAKMGEEINLIRANVNVSYAQAANLRQAIIESASRIALNSSRTEGQNINNRFSNDTYDNRVSTIEAALTGALQRNERGLITIDRERFENVYEQINGYKPGASILEVLPSIIGNGAYSAFRERHE